MKSSIALIAALFSLNATSGSAKVAIVSLAELVESSDLIVLAEVVEVHEAMVGESYATARVIEAWKGSAPEVRFLVSPTWDCDVSSAELNETVVLFLQKQDQKALFVIAHAGRGRMPVSQSKRGPVASLWFEVRVPIEVVVEIGGPRHFSGGVPLDKLKELVQASGKADP